MDRRLKNKGEWDDEPDMQLLSRLHEMLSTNPAAALSGLKELASRGSRMSMNYIGEAYRKGLGTPIDISQSTEWYRRATEAGSVRASYEVGRNYLDIQDFGKALDAFSLGVAKEYSPSLNMLGTMHMEGSGVPVDLGKARELFERAASQGHFFSKRHLAYLLMKGKFGFWRRPKGVLLLLSAMKDMFMVVLRDPLSDRLR